MGGSSSQRAADACSVSAICVAGWVCPARVGRTVGLDEEAALVVGRLLGNHHREDVGHRGAGVAPLGERAAAPEHQQPPAALAHEVGDHPQLVGGEVVGLDAPENEGPVPEQLGPGAGEAAHEVLGRLDPHPHELVLGGALQDRELEVLVVGDGAAQELHLPPRLALEVEDLLGGVLDHDQHVLLVVLRHHLVGLRGDAEAEEPRAGVGGGEADPHRGGLPVGGQGDHLVGDDAPLVLDHQVDPLAAVAGLGDDHVDHEGRPPQHRPGRVDAADLDVLRVRLAPEPDREHRHPRRLQRQQRLLDGAVGVVGAVGDEHEAGQGHARQLLPGPGQGLTDVGPGAVVGQLAHRADAVGARREAEEPHREPVAEGGEQRALVAELAADDVGPRLALDVGDLHAARVVDEDAEEVLLGLDLRQHQHRPPQADHEQGEDGEPDAGEDAAVDGAAVRPHLPVGAQGHHRRRQDEERRHVRRGRGPEREDAFLEREGPVLEQELEHLAFRPRSPRNAKIARTPRGTGQETALGRGVDHGSGPSGSSRRR